MSSFDWGNEDKGGRGSGKDSLLPRHIKRMNSPNEVAEVKKSVSTSDSGLPWGGQPPEQKKAYQSGLPKNKGSVTGPTGERKGSVGSLPHDSHPAHAGYAMQIKSKAACPDMKKKKK
jgi:hypothetical protein